MLNTGAKGKTVKWSDVILEEQSSVKVDALESQRSSKGLENEGVVKVERDKKHD